MSTADEEASISLPSIAFVAVLGFLIYRYFFAGATSSSPRPGTSAASRNGGLRFTPAQVDQIAGMFPQLPRRDIMWDLQRNRGNASVTVERYLTNGRLESAPPSFQPVLPASPMTTGASSAVPAARPNNEPDLITRYNLQGKVDASAKGKGKEEPDYGWASSKDERQAMLQRRRDEMILAARRKMQEKDALGSGGLATTES